jgi:hypothetical protein
MRIDINIYIYFWNVLGCEGIVAWARRCHSASQPFEGNTVELDGRKFDFRNEARDDALDEEGSCYDFGNSLSGAGWRLAWPHSPQRREPFSASGVPRRSKPHFEQNIGSSIYALHRRPINPILERNYI